MVIKESIFLCSKAYLVFALQLGIAQQNVCDTLSGNLIAIKKSAEGWSTNILPLLTVCGGNHEISPPALQRRRQAKAIVAALARSKSGKR